MRILLALFAVVAMAADSKPNFSGAWTLMVAKSDFGSAPAPQSMTTQIDHREPEIKVHSTITSAQGGYSSDYKYVTDGRENSNNVRGSDIKSRVTWEGATLKVAAHAVAGGSQVEFTDHWNLSPDRKTLTMTRAINGPQGRVEQRYIYEKQ